MKEKKHMKRMSEEFSFFFFVMLTVCTLPWSDDDTKSRWWETKEEKRE